MKDQKPSYFFLLQTNTPSDLLQGPGTLSMQFLTVCPLQRLLVLLQTFPLWISHLTSSQQSLKRILVLFCFLLRDKTEPQYFYK